MSDLLRKYKSLYSSTTNTFSTGESVTITPASVVGLPTDTEITLTFDRVDSSGTKTPSKMERIRGTIVGSNFVVSSGGRAVEGTEQVHTSPVVEMIWNADDWNDSVDWGLVEHNQDGTHKSATVTTLKATGAEINTGTEDAKIVTPKAIADSNVLVSSDNVALTSTAAELNLLHGNLGAWTSYVPTLTNVTLGTGGTKSGYYCQIGKTVHFRVKFTLGTSGALTGQMAISLPVAVNSDISYYQSIATGGGFNGADFFNIYIITDGKTYVQLTDGATSKLYPTSATNPFTWANTHSFTMSGTYEAA
jgi:hypothetical protein